MIDIYCDEEKENLKSKAGASQIKIPDALKKNIVLLIRFK